MLQRSTVFDLTTSNDYYIAIRTVNSDLVAAEYRDITRSWTSDRVVLSGIIRWNCKWILVILTCWMQVLDVTGGVTVTTTLDVDGATTLDGLTVAEPAAFSDNVTISGVTTTGENLGGFKRLVGAGSSTVVSIAVTVAAKDSRSQILWTRIRKWILVRWSSITIPYISSRKIILL